MKKVYLHTIGCQMNVYDSERMLTLLGQIGYQSAQHPDDADLIIINTCAVRAKAEQKVFSFLGRLYDLKIKKPDTIIGVCGCVAQILGRKITDRMPFVDIICGTRACKNIADMVTLVSREKRRIIDIQITDDILAFADTREKKVSEFVTIMQGCDNYCSYCVVPYTRGREISRNPHNIINEIQQLAGSGVKEVTLLGQNVNSYGKKQGLCSFSQLLKTAASVQGIKRIRFTTSHPKDLSSELINAFADTKKLCNHIHLPVQSGSNKILKQMNRKYTAQEYLEKITLLKKVSPDIAVTSDFIVGFPGETEADFQKTLNLIQTVDYDGVFAFPYSDRPETAAEKFKDKISESEKKSRLQTLLKLQKSITESKNKAMEGKEADVLAEGSSKKQENQWTGRTSKNRIVNFTVPEHADIYGKIVKVKIKKACANSLFGEMSGL